MPGRISTRWWLLALFVFALSIRLYRNRWDDTHFFHPDERAIGFAVERLSFVPLKLNPQFFAYGSLPIYVVKVSSDLVTRVHPSLRGFDGAILVGRAVSAFWGAATVLLLALLGIKLYDRTAGLLGGLFLAASVSHLQNSHFATSDIPLTALVLATLFLLIRAVESPSLPRFAAAGASLGFALATKFSALPLLLPVAIALLLCRIRGSSWPKVLLAGAVVAAAAGTAFFVGQPYAVLDFPAWSHDILEQSRMVRHAGEVPYTNQYVGTPKYVYDLEQLVLWGMGPLLGLAACIGAGLALARAARRRQAPQILLLSWVVPYFLITGSFQIKFPRYLLPIYPMLALWAAVWLVEKGRASRAWRLAGAAVVAGTLLWVAAFVSIYTRPHSFVTASEWFYENAAPGSSVLIQNWDEGFPFPLSGGRTPERFRMADMSLYEPDTDAKLGNLASQMAAADWLVLQTPRIYGAIGRVPGKFPLTWKLLRHLFAGELGYQLAADFTSRPGFFGIGIPTELADESFSVYDHPKVLIFRNKGRLSREQISDLVRSREGPSLSRRNLLLASAAERPKPVAHREETPASEKSGTKEGNEASAPAGEFEQPRGLAADAQGNVYVADFGHNRIQKLGSTLEPLAAWGSKGTAAGQFEQPAAVAVAPDGRLFVADTWNSRVQVLSPEGKPVSEWRADFYGPRGIASDGSGGAYVADTGNGRIVHLSPKGQVLLQWGSKGSKPSQFVEPIGIAVDRRQRVWVCDNGNSRIQIFDARGNLQSAFPVNGWRQEVFSEPQAAADPQEGVWVTVPLSQEIRLFSPEGKVLRQLRGAAGGPNGFTRPMGIAVGPHADALYVSDLAGRVVRLPMPAKR